MLNSFITLLGKLLLYTSKLLNLGSGSTWPGHIALKLNPHFIRDVLRNSSTQIILIAGTNGKTTTTSLIRHTLTKSGKKVFQNQAGANLLNGIASSLIKVSSVTGRLNEDFALFEVDENALPLLLNEITPSYLILLNLFRDQLDRYGEVHTIAKKWKTAITELPSSTTLILNADDPEVSFLGNGISTKIQYFGLKKNTKKSTEHAADSIYCPNCGSKLQYASVIFSHLGIWQCPACKLKRQEDVTTSAPIFPLPGEYNQYNTIAASLLLHIIGLNEEIIRSSFATFSPAFGRQEILSYKSKHVQLFLSKNPTSFNQSYKTIKELGGKTLLLVLNDRIPDGRDVSWIWDVDLPDLNKFERILLAGDRVYDMALRIKYENYKQVETYEKLEDAIHTGIAAIKNSETLYVLPTYSAMLDVRKILTGRKIL